MKIEKVISVRASHVRSRVTNLANPDPSTVLVIRRHGSPVMLIWPCGGLLEDGEMRVKLNWAIKARNVFAKSEAVMPLYPQTWQQTALRRNASDVYLNIASHPTPGLITHYGLNVAIYVPVRQDSDVETWVSTMNNLLE